MITKIVIEIGKDTVEYNPDFAYELYKELKNIFEKHSQLTAYSQRAYDQARGLAPDQSKIFQGIC